MPAYPATIDTTNAPTAHSTSRTAAATHLREVCVDGHEGPLVLGDRARVGQRQRRRDSPSRRRSSTTGHPTRASRSPSVASGAESRAEARQLARRAAGRPSSRRARARYRMPIRSAAGSPRPGAALGGSRRQELVSHARSPRSTSSICASGTRSSSWCARCGSPGP